jgi:hypothetical protein
LIRNYPGFELPPDDGNDDVKNAKVRYEEDGDSVATDENMEKTGNDDADSDLTANRR